MTLNTKSHQTKTGDHWIHLRTFHKENVWYIIFTFRDVFMCSKHWCPITSSKVSASYIVFLKQYWSVIIMTQLLIRIPWLRAGLIWKKNKQSLKLATVTLFPLILKICNILTPLRSMKYLRREFGLWKLALSPPHLPFLFEVPVCLC
jgi:hypothetical protein